MDPNSAVHELEYQQIHQLSMLSTTNLPGQCSNFLVFMLKHAWSISPISFLSLYLMIWCTGHAIKSRRQCLHAFILSTFLGSQQVSPWSRILTLDDSKSRVHFHPWEHVPVFGCVKHGQWIIRGGDQKKHLFMKRWPMVSSLNSTAHINSLQQLCVGIPNAGGICHSFLNCHLGILTLAIVHLLKDNIRPQTSAKVKKFWRLFEQLKNPTAFDNCFFSPKIYITRLSKKRWIS